MTAPNIGGVLLLDWRETSCSGLTGRDNRINVRNGPRAIAVVVTACAFMGLLPSIPGGPAGATLCCFATRKRDCCHSLPPPPEAFPRKAGPRAAAQFPALVNAQ